MRKRRAASGKKGGGKDANWIAERLPSYGLRDKIQRPPVGNRKNEKEKGDRMFLDIRSAGKKK